jgi:hypothetical protein
MRLLLRKLLRAGRKAPPPEEVRHEIAESSERMSSVEASLRALRVRLEVMSHQRGEAR